jgi:GTP-binding protein
MFVDQADIQVFAGDGGKGCSSFRREKRVPMGGPDGGDGGKGGSVYLEATPGVDTLLDMMGRHHWYAERGNHGLGKKKAGSDGKDLIIRVPPGTLVYDVDSGVLLADLKTPGKAVRMAKGGQGGRGNTHFATSVKQAPEFAEPGGKGEMRNLHLELRLIADVGLVGLPNAGKSTLLAHVSAARPKIADYPFTTLVPQLGIAELDSERRLVLADIPGLIEGAHAGHGLGLDFLRHIERTRVIVHLLDVLPLDGTKPAESYRQIRTELAAYSPKLAAKAEILVANKMDLAGASEALADLRDALPGKQILAISAVAGTGLRPLLEAVYRQVQLAPPAGPFLETVPMVRAPEPHPEDVALAGDLYDDVRKHEADRAAVLEEGDAGEDPELAAEIAAIKADDLRKRKYYGRGPGGSLKAPTNPVAAAAKAPPVAVEPKPARRAKPGTAPSALRRLGKTARRGTTSIGRGGVKGAGAHKKKAATSVAAKVKKKKGDA